MTNFVQTTALYESPPGSGSNDGAIPTVWTPAWPGYSNLTDAQKAAFLAMPADLINYARTQRWLAEISGTSVTINNVTIPLRTLWEDKINIIGLRQAIDDGLITGTPFFDNSDNMHVVDAAGAKALNQAVVGFIAQLWQAVGQIATGVNAAPPTITTRKQVDAILAAVAPNSPSAKNPSPT